MIKKIHEEAWKKINIENQLKSENYISEVNNSEEGDNFYSSADDSSISNSDFGIMEDESNFESLIKNSK